MRVRDLLDLIESWAPREVAWEKDNIGLQCGDPEAPVRGVLVALDPTPEVVDEAVRRSASVIITHHPLLFRPLQRVDVRSLQGRIVQGLLSRGISLLSAHTNLDFSPEGTSHALATALGLTSLAFLHTPYRLQKKIVTFVPASHVDLVADAMAEAGAGVIGNYDRCSFRAEGTGTFRGNSASHPAVGQAGAYERTGEVRLEMVAPSWKVHDALQALRAVHPYEEVAVDVYATETPERGFGMGVIGWLPAPLALSTFLRRVKKVLNVRALRCSSVEDQPVQHIAVCGGSGADLLADAARQGAEVFVTADVKYHAFHDAVGRVVLVDAGHYETERPVVDALVSRLKNEFRRQGARVPVQAASTLTNPVRIV